MESSIGTGIRYAMVTGYNTTDNKNFKMTRIPFTHGLMKDFGQGYDHTMQLLIKNSNEFNFILAAKIMDFEENFHKFKEGNYSDVLTLHMSY